MGRRGSALTPTADDRPPAAEDRAAADRAAADRAAADRAAAAERAVLDGSVRRLWALPDTALGVNRCPAGLPHRLFLVWNYWWQAHLLDCLVDAELRTPDLGRRAVISRLVRGIRIRNGGRWTNAYHDDMAWLGLALERAGRLLGQGRPDAVRILVDRLLRAWSAELGGGVPWRRGDEFKNTPANGPAAILLARTGHLDRAVATADWIDALLRDPDTGLIWDGARPDGHGGIRVETPVYTYNQGVVLGADVELARRTRSEAAHLARVHRLVAAVDERLTASGVLRGHAGGDPGLFSGILARYLALVAAQLPGSEPAAARTRELAGELVRRSAAAAWANRAVVDDHPVFGPEWSRPARPPGPGAAEADLSVQLAGWMLLEAAAVLGRH